MALLTNYDGDREMQVRRREEGMVDRVRVLSWVRASDAEVRTGMLGFISVEYGDLMLDSIVLRKTADGRFALSFPARTDRGGRRHAYIRPRDNEARVTIEREILSQLGQREASPAEVADG